MASKYLHNNKIIVETSSDKKYLVGNTILAETTGTVSPTIVTQQNVGSLAVTPFAANITALNPTLVTQQNVGSLAVTPFAANITATLPASPTIVTQQNLGNLALTPFTATVTQGEEANNWFNNSWWITPTFSNTWWESITDVSFTTIEEALTLTTYDVAISSSSRITTIVDALGLTTYPVAIGVILDIYEVVTLPTALTLTEHIAAISPNVYTIQYSRAFTSTNSLLGTLFTQDYNITQYSVDPSFDSSCGGAYWTCSGVTIASNIATFATPGDNLTQTMLTGYEFTSGQAYTVTVNVTALGGGTIDVSLGGGTAVNVSSTGEQEIIVTAGATNNNLVLASVGATNATMSLARVDLITGTAVAPSSYTNIGSNMIEYTVYLAPLDTSITKYVYEYPTGDFQDTVTLVPMNSHTIDLIHCE